MRSPPVDAHREQPCAYFEPYSVCWARGARRGQAAFQPCKIVLSDSCSALLTTSHRSQATGSISFSIAALTQSRRSLGSIASSSSSGLRN